MARHPIYVVSKGRHHNCLTARFLIRDKVPFSLVVEREEVEAYSKYGHQRLLILPHSNRGVVYARNWVFDHALAQGAEAFWILDDNINCMKIRHQGKRIPCDSDLGFTAVEDFAARYENVAIAGMNYEMFVINGMVIPPYRLNVHVYSCCLINTAMPYRWRNYLNEDTDLCLQALSGGWCTVLTNQFLVFKTRTMKMQGGNTGIYQGDGRLKMARSLERVWPGVVTTKRRFGRPQHSIKGVWTHFTTPLKLKPGLPPADASRYAMRLSQVKPIRSQTVATLVQEFNEREAS